MIARDRQDIRPLPQENGQRGVEILDRLSFGVEVAVLAVFVRVLVVDEEVIVVRVFAEVALELLGDGLGSLDPRHAHQLRQALVHRVHRERRGAQAVALLDGGNLRLMRNPPHEEAVGRALILQQRQRGFVEVGDQLGRLLLLCVLGVHGLRGGNAQAFAVGIGVGERAFETGAAEEDHEPMFLAGLNDHLRGADLFDLPAEQRAKFLAFLGGNAPGPAVGDEALRVERAEVGAGRHVAALEFEAQPERFDHPPAHCKLERIVAEQAEMTGTAAGGDARCDRNHATLRAAFGHETVEVGCVGGLEGRYFAMAGGGDVAETVENDQGQFGAGLDGEFCIQFVEGAHGRNVRFRMSAKRVAGGRNGLRATRRG